MSLETRFRQAFTDSIALKRRVLEELGPEVIAAAELLAQVFKAGGRVLIFGNGGSAADAQHLAAEFVNRFQVERPPLAALALTTDTSILTAVANDYDFREVFAKQVRALGNPGTWPGASAPAATRPTWSPGSTRPGSWASRPWP